MQLHILPTDEGFKHSPHLCYGCNQIFSFADLWRHCNCKYPSAPYFRGICKDCASKYRGRLPQELPYAPKNIDQHYLKSTDPIIALNELTNTEDITRTTLE